MKHIGLFEGIGGFSLAARWMGWTTKAWCEWNPFCQQVLKHHFPEAKGHGDITKTDFTNYANTIDILTGGFPCQPFSTAGKRKGTEDERYLWKEMLRAIREIQPRWILGENVRGLTNWNGGMVFNTVQADLEAEGYEITPFLLPACAVNAPHRRDRIWFIAYSASVRCNRNNVKGQAVQWANKTCRETGASSNEIITDTCNQGLQGRKKYRSTASCRKERNEQFAGLFQSAWDKFPTQPALCSRNDGLSSRLAGITFSKHRNESIKAYGNAIVPQVAYEIFKAIEQYESNEIF